jgi:hypothetical protein
VDFLFQQLDKLESAATPVQLVENSAVDVDVDVSFNLALSHLHSLAVEARRRHNARRRSGEYSDSGTDSEESDDDGADFGPPNLTVSIDRFTDLCRLVVAKHKAYMRTRQTILKLLVADAMQSPAPTAYSVLPLELVCPAAVDFLLIQTKHIRTCRRAATLLCVLLCYSFTLCRDDFFHLFALNIPQSQISRSN